MGAHHVTVGDHDAVGDHDTVGAHDDTVRTHDDTVAAHDDTVAARDDAVGAHGDTLSHGELVEPPRAESSGGREADAPATQAAPAAPVASPSPIDFIKESADSDAQYYRASDNSGIELFAGFYTDGRVRLANAAHRFAGMVRNGRADLLDIENNAWSELFLSVTPSGQMQLELRGGPYDARVLTCDKVATI